jgi:hypothetical protein
VDDKEELPENEQIKIDMGEGQMKKVKRLVINGVCFNKLILIIILSRIMFW